MLATVAESLFERGGHDAQDQMRRYVDIARTHGSGLSADLRRALATWQWSRKPNAGSHDPKNLDPHSLTRSVAAALYRLDDPTAAMDLAADLSRTTQQSPVVLDLCRLWAAVLVDAIRGADREVLVGLHGDAAQALRARKLRAELDALLGNRGVVSLRDGDAVSVTARTLRAFGQGRGFIDGFGASLDGASSPVSAALYGALAGAFWGGKSLPASWLRALALQGSLRTLSRRFVV
jgi:ADP-ribosyl-[dinitrogen reductase] hydrolase